MRWLRAHDAVVAAIDAAAETAIERARQPGLTLGLTDRDGTLLIRTYGFADLASRQPVTPDTLFEIGSIGKTFTATEPAITHDISCAGTNRGSSLRGRPTGSTPSNLWFPATTARSA